MTTEVKTAFPRKGIVRFDIHQRIQHAVLMATFIILALTGLPLKFHNWSVSQWWVQTLGGIDVTRSIHHAAAWVMAACCAYHLIYIAYTTLVLKKPFPVKMIPNRRDFTNLFQEIRYFVGLTKEHPRFDRFNWREKFDYWAIFWGMPVMGVSGFILAYPVFTTKFLSGWVVPTALVAHSDEAVLAVVWIITVHLIFNHLAPHVFPINTSIFTGKVSAERYRLEHPAELEGVLGADSEKKEASKP